ncbi:15805_t:CDS:2, partial [Entrophospora sp. SA101]
MAGAREEERQQSVHEHVPVNNFNAQEVSDFLNNSWIEAMGKLRDNTIPDSEKPELYKSTENAWGSKSGPVWGQRAHLMANGKDFFNELRKSSSTIVVQQQQSLLQQQPSNNVQSTNRPSTPSSPTSLSSSTSSLSLTTLSSSTVTTTAATNTTAPSSPTTPTTPKDLTKVDCGKFGSISVAYWPKIRKKVAVKRLLAFGEDDSANKKFVHELQIQKRVEYHDNIIRILGISQAPLLTYHCSLDPCNKDRLLVLQYAKDGNLRDYLARKHSTLTWNDKFKIAFGIADGLNCLHDENIVHCDF